MIPIQIREGIYIAAIVLLLGCVAWFAHHERLVQRTADAQSDAAAVLKETTADQAKVADDFNITRDEGKTYADVVAHAVAGAPVIELCSDPPRPVYAAAETKTGSGAHGATQLRGADTPVPAVIRWNTAPVVQLAHDADAQIRGLQDYINRVCPTL